MFEVVLYCIVVLFSVLCSSACFILQWFHPSARSLSHPRSLSILPSRFCVASSGFNLSCLVLLLSISAASSRCFFALFPSSRFSVNPFFFHAALLYESPRRKLGWQVTAGVQFWTPTRWIKDSGHDTGRESIRGVCSFFWSVRFNTLVRSDFCSEQNVNS